MKSIQILVLLIFCATFQIQAQVTEKFNLSFAGKKNDKALATGWFKWGSYALSIDSLVSLDNYSGKVTADSAGSEFGAIVYRIPAHYTGKKIRLEGYMKISQVADGFAGLVLRIDADNKSVAFDNMQDQQITGTRDWQKYSLELDYPTGAENIYVAGMLVGKGEAWFDNFSLYIDDQNVQTLTETPPTLLPAQQDKAFDNGSTITLDQLTDKQVNNLVLLGKVWGFLKYYHPEVAKGNFHWDYELFRMLPQYLPLEDTPARDQFLINWISSLGKVQPCVNCVTLDSTSIIKPDHAWIKQQATALQQALQYVYDNRTNSKHYYLDLTAGAGNPIFKNEKTYSSMPYPDAGYRLLSLFRYWNVIHYFFPYKAVADQDWSDMLKANLPHFIEAKDELAYELAVLAIIGQVQDTHASIYSGHNKIEEWKGGFYAPFQVRFIENKLVVSDYYNPELQSASNPQIGDEILQVNGKDIADLIEEKLHYYPASNRVTQLRNLAEDILRSVDSSASITFSQADGRTHRENIALYAKNKLNIYRFYKKSDAKAYRMMPNNIGYISLQTIQADDIPVIQETFKDAKGIIIDIRNYPATFVPFTLGSFFLSSPKAFVKFTKPNMATPGAFEWTPALEIPNQATSFNGPLVVLVNELSVSQSEYTAMAFRASENCTIMGSTTAGADGNVSAFGLPGGLQTGISGIGVFYPDGQPTQRIGIVPDLEVNPTVAGIRNKQDEVLDHAVNFILEKAQK